MQRLSALGTWTEARRIAATQLTETTGGIIHAMSDELPPADRERLAQIEWLIGTVIGKIAEAFSRFQPRAPRECRRLRVLQIVTVAGLVIGLVLVLWTVLGWVVAVLLTLKLVAATVLLAGDFEADADGASI